MKYAIIKINGRDYKVSEGDIITVDKLKDTKLIPTVLFLSDGEKAKIGKPSLPDVKVVIKVIEQEVKGEKVRILKYKAKSRYTKRMGFRPIYSRIQIVKIG